MGLINLLNDEVGNFKFYTSKGYTGNGVEPGMKSLKFGKDRPGGGDSGQPYIQDPILDNPLPNSPDFILRGGLNAPIDAAQDVVRLTKYMFNLKSPSGLLFTAKQNLLSRVAPKTEAAKLKGAAYAGGALNEGVYTPLSTLAQAGVGFAGIHLNKQGIDPTGLLPGLSINKYEKIVYENNLPSNNKITTTFPIGAIALGNAIASQPLIGGLNPFAQTNNFSVNENVNQTSDLGTFKNRLLDLWWSKNISPSLSSDPNVIREYGGGPGSILGIGKTKIKFATDNSGEVPLRTLSSYEGAWSYKTISSINPDNIAYKTAGGILPDFRGKLKKSSSPSTFLSVSPGYNNKNNIESLYNLGNPGQKGDVSSFTQGKKTPAVGDTPGNVIGPLDKITAYPIYKSREGARQTDELNDLISFNIAILNNDIQAASEDSSEYYSWKKFIHFRAFIDSFSDTYGADWDPISYMGRAEKFYKYKGFNRDISLDFTVVAQSRQELGVMYDKLNFLASSLAPEYLDSANAGYMAGNIAYLTVGDYIVDQPGIITGLTYGIPEESSWELARDEFGGAFPLEAKENGELRQLPLMIKVSGFKFTPIHKFRVEKVRWKNDGLGKSESDVLQGTINQKYIDPLFKKTTPPFKSPSSTPQNGDISSNSDFSSEQSFYS